MRKQDIENYINNSQYKWEYTKIDLEMVKGVGWKTKVNDEEAYIMINTNGGIDVLITLDGLTYHNKDVGKIEFLDEVLKYMEKR